MWKCTDKSGAARKAPHANARTPGSLKVASRKRHPMPVIHADVLSRHPIFSGNAGTETGIVGKGYADVLKRDATRRVEPALPKYPKEVLQMARERGVSVPTLLALAKLDNHLKGK